MRGGVQSLAARGVLAVVQGTRTRVVSSDVGREFKRLREPRFVNEYPLHDIHAARLLVERTVVGDAAERIDAETLVFLKESLRTQHAAVDDPVRFLISDREFHLAIYRACGNAALSDYVGDLYAFMMEHRRRAVSVPGAALRSCGDHQLIVEALERRDRAATVDAFEIHINRIHETTLTILDEDGAASGAAGRGRVGDG